jgi:hypothetical protein
MTFSVAFDGADAVASAQLRPVLASVPERFHVVDGPEADVVVVSAARGDWLDRLEAAIELGVRGVLIASPGPAAVERLRALSHTQTPVGVAIGYVAGRSWRQALPRVKADLPSAVLLDTVVTYTGAGTSALLAQLATVRSLVGPVLSIQLVHGIQDLYAATAQVANLVVNLTGVASTCGSNTLRIDLVGPERRWRAQLNADALARPSEIVCFDASGAHAEPLVYESPHRAVLLELYAALSDGSSLSYTLEDLARDVDLAAPIVSLM